MLIMTINDEVMTFYIQKVKGQLHCGLVTLSGHHTYTEQKI